ncbi:ABC-three component system middle component 1 [Lactococcus raffinolactis]|uniref:ABC-three component system middle component 1 n=1 Tax=Pseudolactococcus raffinolactis TaxID=1366 RepID=UPI0034CFC9B6
MLEMINGIFEEYSYELKDKSEIGTFFSSADDYFITHEYTDEELGDFFELDKTEKILDKFVEFKKENEKIAKNTSLIILVKTDNMKQFYEDNKNKIMRIEEDEYYFRKYVITYTEKGVESLKNRCTNSKEIFNFLNEDGKMKKFEEDLYFADNYFIAMQLMIKLPFVSLNLKQGKFKQIDERINDRLKKEDLKEVNSSVDNFLEKITDEKLTELEKMPFINEDDSEILTEICGIFGVE